MRATCAIPSLNPSIDLHLIAFESLTTYHQN